MPTWATYYGRLVLRLLELVTIVYRSQGGSFSFEKRHLVLKNVSWWFQKRHLVWKNVSWWF